MVICMIIAIIFAVILFALITYRITVQNRILAKAKVLVKNGGISETAALDIGGMVQHILIEGKDLTKPILLLLHGGPGQPFPFGVSARTLFPELTSHFITVYYDQRGAGKSYYKGIDKKTMNANQFMSDVDELISYLQKRFKKEKIYLAGMSWGSIIGIKLAQKFPAKLHAYIGFDQITSITEGQKLAYEWLVSKAGDNNDKRTLHKLHKLGGPPYFNEREKSYSDLIHAGKGYIYKDEKTKAPSIMALIKGAFISPDYTLKDTYKSLISGVKFNIFKCEEMQKEIMETDLSYIKELKVPVYIIQGRHDLTANYSLAQKFFNELNAPEGKRFITLENSAHIPNEQDFKKLVTVIAEMNHHK